ncbi:hypothetical protein [Trichocoleus sp. FACHB-262]|uniref:hypothetical protein n=1 Tax=Trichocoleus sp. FACHB-262 TaxID=2692869 RepID=UPI00168527F8|nr:hypothetical protein [Trichocoleus sp. FACHB-262]MBD2121318.1 hypothetical protein [Trichocoleus sp. FACHB-262]
MKPEVITAIIAAIVAVASAVISIYGQTRIARLTDQLAKQREAKSREAQTAAVMSRYRDPLLRSAIDLQSRLYNIHQNGFLERFFQRSPSAQSYAINNTLYVVAEYLGWVEILRREIQFLDLGDLELNRRLSELLVNINQGFAYYKGGAIFQLHNGEQRAIGEIMTVPRSSSEAIGYDCIGYATFVKKMSEPEFAGWFAMLRDDIETMGKASKIDAERLVLIHSKLIDLIDFLDPHHVRVPPKYRTRIEQK